MKSGVIPRIIHFSLPLDPSGAQLALIDVARSRNPEWRVMLWDDDIRPSDSRLDRYLPLCASGSQRSDLIRCDALLQFGGVYLDADFHVLRALDDLIKLGGFLICSEDGQRLTNAFLASPPGHAALHAIVEHWLENEPDWTLPPNMTTGPEFFSSILRVREDVTVLPRETFYPYNWNEAPCAMVPATTYAVHLWDNSWKPAKARRNGGRSAKVRRGGQQWVDRAKARLRRFLSDEPPSVFPYGVDVVARTKQNLFMVLPGSDLSVTPALALRGEFEPESERFVAATIRGGDWMIDVGANCGLFSLIAAARCGPFGRVIAIEPDSDLCAYIRKSLLANWLHDRVRVLDVAASDVEDVVEMVSLGERRGDTRIAPAASDAPMFARSCLTAVTSVSFSANTRRLDDIVPVDMPIKLLKIDAEGHEVEVLRGARRLFQTRSIENMMIEVSMEYQGRKFRAFLEEIRLIVELGYNPHCIGPTGALSACANFEQAIPTLGHRNMVFQAPGGLMPLMPPI
jgi:FkbM family methyltransferase